MEPPASGIRHCWVLDSPAAQPRQGLILEWKKTNGGDWAARVVYIPNPAKPRSIETWFHEAHVRPVTARDFGGRP